MINGTDGLLVGGDGGAKISDAGSNGFANEDNVDLVLVFGSILWWCFLFIMPAPIFDREVVTDFPNFSFPISKGRLKNLKKYHEWFNYTLPNRYLASYTEFF